MIGLHMIHPQAGDSSGRSHPESNVIRVGAKTAQPLLVGSVPSASRSSRSQARRQQQVVAGHHLSTQSHHQQHRKHELASDKVLLIVNDDHIKGGGVPVIGRRLPSKSIAPMGSSPLSPVPLYSQVDCTGPCDGQRQAFSRSPLPVPVIGRRSHRMLQQQQQRGTTYQYDYHDGQKQEHLEAAHDAHLLAKMHGKPLMQSPVRLLALHPNNSHNHSHPSGHRSPSRLVSSRSRHLKYQSASAMNIAEPMIEYSLPPMQKAPHRSKRSSRPSGKVAAQMGSCSSLCSGGHLQEPLLGSYALCCTSCQPAELEAHTCLEPCCSPPFEGSLVRTASCQQVQLACCTPKRLPSAGRHEAYPVSCHSSQPKAARLSQASSHNNHHDHHSCQANGSAAPPTYRMGACQEGLASKPMLISGRNVLPVHPKPNVHYLSLVNNEAAVSRKESASKTPVKAESPEASAVSQMYESLAAELKAKLGDPNMGPILLPPKDYDTMSRKQGRLSGIELRRSTNPALVGPAASNRLSSTSGSTINEEAKQLVAGSSARSSGREKSSADDRSSQCSRSNSSSGLGSISMGLSSPNLSPLSKLSSNEDMHQPGSSSQARQCADGFNRSSDASERSPDNRHYEPLRHVKPPSGSSSSSPVERKGSSPDNCGASDSGHSGSGGLDSTISGLEDQKMSLRDNSDYFEGNAGKYRNCRSGARKSHGEEDSAKGRRAPPPAVQSQPSKANSARGSGIHNYNPSRVSDGSLWNGRVEVPLKVNIAKNTYLATKQIIY